MILRPSLNLPEDATYIRTTRLLSRCLLDDMRVTRATIDDVETIVAELCSNVVRHAHAHETNFILMLECYKPQVVIKVVDQGLGFVTQDILPAGTVRSDGHGKGNATAAMG
jgi:anti-sigma regulatory factor (Ser/Thr protein kinase)